MSRHVAGAVGSKWGNPFKPKKGNRNSLKKCLERYEDHVRRNPRLFNAVLELEGKELGSVFKFKIPVVLGLVLLKAIFGTTSLSTDIAIV